MYLALTLKKKTEITALGITKNIDICWTDGQIGALPVFDKEKDALRYVGGDESLIMKIKENNT